MANFGSFEYDTGQTYGPDSELTVSEVEMIYPTLVRITFSGPVVVNSTYFDIDNYLISLYRETYTDANPKRVLVPFMTDSEDEDVTTDRALLQLEALSIGSTYTFTVQNVQGTNQAPIVMTETHRTARRTKPQAAVATLPNHYDSRFDSNLASLITAFAIEDDHIGGSERERIS